MHLGTRTFRPPSVSRAAPADPLLCQPPWSHHFHPSVSLFAARLLAAGPAPPKPDPAAHTLMHFLDRFAYRKPRANAAAPRGTSLMQPALGATGAAGTLLGAPAAAPQPLNGEAFWSRRAADVAADEVFFHRYFADTAPRRAAARKAKKAKGGEEGSDVGLDDVDDEGEAPGEDEIWKALVGSRPELDVEGSEDDDDDEDDLSMGDDDEDDGDGNEDDVDIEGSDDDLAGILDGEENGQDEGEDEDEEGVALHLDDDADSALFSSEDEDVGAPSTAAVPSLEDVQARRRSDKREPRKRRKLNLPTFASADDYAKLLAGDDDDEPDGGY